MTEFIKAFPWSIALILLPLTGGIISLLWPRVARPIGLISIFSVLFCTMGLALFIREHGVLRHVVGGWPAPLGIELRADGLSLIMLVITAIVGLGISLYASAYFKDERPARFWPIWLILLGSLNALFLSSDIFNLYVTLELVGIGSVALVTLADGKEALGSAMRYLLATLLGSLAYLLGVVLLYHGFATVDITTLATRADSSFTLWAALGLIASGLALKSALFPLHFWLPSAHASAPAPVSALLSALVVKASFYILLRLWCTVFQPHLDHSGIINVSTVFGLLGSAAILWGSLQALRQVRLKLLVAYSTVAQLGYLFLAFPLAIANGVTAWHAVLYLAFSHALAKAAMFLAAGNLLRFGGHDRILDLDRVVQRLPITAGAFALGGVSIMGLPPSGGFIGKWLLLQSALAQGRWDLALVIVLGSLLAAGYIFKVLGYAFTEADVAQDTHAVPARMEWMAFLLAASAILLGFLAAPVLSLLDIGSPFGITGTGP